MLVLDAIERAPSLFCVLTAREYLSKDETVKQHLEKVTKALRRRWPEYEYFARWEVTKAGRLHVNLLVKGVPVADLADFRRVLVERWCSRVDAEPVGQYVEEVEDGTAVTLYVSKKVLHAGKTNQEPGLKYKHRTSQSRGYLVRPAAVMREEARASLAVEARHWRAQRWAAHLTPREESIPAALVEACHDVLQERDELRSGHWLFVHRDPSSAKHVPSRSPAVDQGVT